mmetsp:Transcript_49508/g.67373  ORF Transcript_49508/g.67373 Transcript_49508/m.67373 type:complete len:98 (-) Transcript_49508:346-639(-)
MRPHGGNKPAPVVHALLCPALSRTFVPGGGVVPLPQSVASLGEPFARDVALGCCFRASPPPIKQVFLFQSAEELTSVERLATCLGKPALHQFTSCAQ